MLRNYELAAGERYQTKDEIPLAWPINEIASRPDYGSTWELVADTSGRVWEARWLVVASHHLVDRARRAGHGATLVVIKRPAGTEPQAVQ